MPTFVVKIIEDTTSAGLETAIGTYVTGLGTVTTLDIQYQVVLQQYFGGVYILSYSALITST